MDPYWLSSEHVLPKSDNSLLDDISINPSGRSRAITEEVVGLVRGCVPYLGWITIVITEYPWVTITGLLAWAVVASSDWEFAE
jgi:hypothetical protein